MHALHALAQEPPLPSRAPPATCKASHAPPRCSFSPFDSFLCTNPCTRAPSCAPPTPPSTSGAHQPLHAFAREIQCPPLILLMPPLGLEAILVPASPRTPLHTLAQVPPLPSPAPSAPCKPLQDLSLCPRSFSPPLWCPPTLAHLCMPLHKSPYCPPLPCQSCARPSKTFSSAPSPFLHHFGAHLPLHTFAHPCPRSPPALL